ncbi:hypothetical protein DSO57_1032176 [Entomophthora muscae]|uniref:Uncharacterized protein n=1 Tax=Entomophthora muscae TaxID=34485 RepID=A0ACC2U9G3_9FUNG|nr:hypothetical protein DSO57_1032176 [Entomophthora muscae]
MPSIYPKLHTGRIVPAKSSKRAYSTDSRGAQVIKHSLRCGATMRAILSDNLGAITSADVVELNSYFGTRQGKPILETIHYSNLKFDGDRGRVLGSLISSPCLGVRRIIFNQLNLDKETVRAIIKGISRAPSLERVTITRCSLRDKDLGSILMAVAQNPNITTLVLDQNSFSGAGCEALARNTGKLRALSLSGHFFGPDSAQYISELLRSNIELQELDLSRNQLRANGMHNLSPAFLFNHTLLSINLSGNEISPEGCVRLCQGLEDNRGLQHLNLAFNHVGDQGVEAICKLLKVNRTILFLQLDMNRLSPESGRLLGAMLKKNSALKSLSLDSNLLLGVGAAAIAAALPYNEYLENLSLSDNEIGNEGVQAFAFGLPNNTVLQRLVLKNARVQDPAVYRGLVSSLENNRAIKMLDMDFDFIGWEAVYKTLQPLLTRNYIMNRKEFTAAVQVLWGVRALCHPSNWSSPPPPGTLGGDCSLARR